MVQRSKGMRSKSRNILRKNVREAGQRPITRLLRQFEPGSRVAIKIDSASQKGMPHIRFQGHTGVVQGKQGESFVVKLTVGKKEKTIVARAEHLKTVF